MWPVPLLHGFSSSY
ncbi:hypothetical protein EC52239_1646, partial [Escherichia coli 5.2239]